MVAIEEKVLIAHFFSYLYEGVDGYICICTQPPDRKDKFAQTFFEWPTQGKELLAFVEKKGDSNNVWFGVNLLSAPDRSKPYCRTHNLVWADFDTANPYEVTPRPQCIIESSPERFQGIWRLDQSIDPYLAEIFSKKIAYKYREQGADKSGWDLTQLLRVPYTRNFKYDKGPVVLLREAASTLCPIEFFEQLDVVVDDPDDPLSDPLPIEYPDALQAIYKYQHKLNKTAFRELFDSEPPETADWSGLMWRLINIMFEADMEKEEVYAVALQAKCNKYMRDGRSPYYLWREILKSFLQQRRLEVLTTENYRPLVMPTLVSEDESLNLQPTFVDRYREWASEATDAVIDFHNLSAFMLMSFFISGTVKLETSHGSIVPNLWGLVLGDSTLTRKSTSMKMAMDFVYEIDRELVLASEGSVEGILTGLSLRPERVSIFFKDEITGLVESMQKKDYMAGMKETFTQLYDANTIHKRMLRKEVIEIIKPVFIIFGGGIREKLNYLVNEEFITSGFMPRFIIVSGETDLSRLKHTGPPTQVLSNQKDKIRDEIADFYENYGKVEVAKDIAGQTIMAPVMVKVELTDQAWERYGLIEDQITEASINTTYSLTASPSFHRLKDSMLKMAILLAASRQTPNADNIITVELRDIIGAASYTQKWGNFTVDLIVNHGRTTLQKTLDKAKLVIGTKPGLLRGEVSRSLNTTKRETDEILNTLIDRGEVRAEHAGKSVRLWPI